MPIDFIVLSTNFCFFASEEEEKVNRVPLDNYIGLDIAAAKIAFLIILKEFDH